MADRRARGQLDADPPLVRVADQALAAVLGPPAPHRREARGTLGGQVPAFGPEHHDRGGIVDHQGVAVTRGRLGDVEVELSQLLHTPLVVAPGLRVEPEDLVLARGVVAQPPVESSSGLSGVGPRTEHHPVALPVGVDGGAGGVTRRGGQRRALLGQRDGVGGLDGGPPPHPSGRDLRHRCRRAEPTGGGVVAGRTERDGPGLDAGQVGPGGQHAARVGERRVGRGRQVGECTQRTLAVVGTEGERRTVDPVTRHHPGGARADRHRRGERERRLARVHQRTARRRRRAHGRALRRGEPRQGSGPVEARRVDRAAGGTAVVGAEQSDLLVGVGARRSHERAVRGERLTGDPHPGRSDVEGRERRRGRPRRSGCRLVGEEPAAGRIPDLAQRSALGRPEDADGGLECTVGGPRLDVTADLLARVGGGGVGQPEQCHHDRGHEQQSAERCDECEPGLPRRQGPGRGARRSAGLRGRSGRAR